VSTSVRGRIAKLAGAGLPTLSTGLVRALQLLVLIVLAQAPLPEADRNVLVVGFGLIASFAMMTDSGAANFLLSTPAAQLVRFVYTQALIIHTLLATAGVAAAVCFLLIPLGGDVHGDLIVVLMALAGTQALDSVTRIARTPLLTQRRDAAFAVPDFVLFALKLPLLLAAYFSGSLGPVLLMPAASLLVLLVILLLVGRQLPTAPPTISHLWRRILEFGATGALSAAQTQLPLLVATLVFPLSQVASLTIVYRIVQALDVLPGTLSLQMIPRARDRALSVWRFWLSFTAGGLLIALALIAVHPLVGELFEQPITGMDLLVYVAVALSFAPKSGNYAFVAFLMGTGRIRLRLLLTAGGVSASFILSLGAAALDSLLALALIPLLVEMTFALVGRILTLTPLSPTRPSPATEYP